jgi:hypothetical protein
MTGELSIDYEALARDAMRGIVCTALRRVADLGYLPGEHHFYIAFDTRAPGVVLSERLKERYPEEMTIVLQHQFHDLSVDEDCFAVTLSFNGKLERLTVPLPAVRVFFDPSVPYGLQFDSSDLAAARAADETSPAEVADGDRSEATYQRPQRGLRDTSAEPGAPAKVRAPRKPRAAQGEPAKQSPAASAADGNVAEPTGAAMSRSPAGRPVLVQPKPDEPANDSKVVQLDKFRKR